MNAELRLAPRPELVRTARLVAGVAARRSGLGDDVVDDVRLAVGVAAARAVVRLGERRLDTPVLLHLDDDGTRFTVHVHDATDPAEPDLDEGVALAVVEALAGASEVRGDRLDGSVVVMSWPVPSPTG